MSRSHRIAAAAALLGLFAASGLAAQTSATAEAKAFVVGIAPLTATWQADLDFGTVSAGTVATPASLASDAARFAIAGEPSTPVTVTFTLPTVLTFGANTIPISFGGSDGLEWTAYPTTFITFNPNGAYLTSLDGSGDLLIGLSGTVSPPLGSITGLYTGTITMTVSY
jgi:hypothetical protein